MKQDIQVGASARRFQVLPALDPKGLGQPLLQARDFAPDRARGQAAVESIARPQQGGGPCAA